MTTLIESLKWRYACKEFDASKKISDKDFDTLIEGLILTASSYGAQPWQFVVVKNPGLREKLIEASYNQEQVRDASHLFVMCRPDTIDEAFVDDYIQNICDVRSQETTELAGLKKMLMFTASKDDATKASWAKNQIYIALGNLLTLCADLRIDSCPMEGFVPSKVDDILNLSELGLKSVVLCPVGYRSKTDKYQSLAKVRQEKSKLIKIIE